MLEHLEALGVTGTALVIIVAIVVAAELVQAIRSLWAFIADKFDTYHSLAKNEALSDSVREAATNAMYEEFGTGKKDTFLAKRNDGEYDRGFYGIAPAEKSRRR